MGIFPVAYAGKQTLFLSILILSCQNTKGVQQQNMSQEPLDTTVSVHIRGAEAEFIDYLPTSPAPLKRRCNLMGGVYRSLVQPWKVDAQEWIYVNFGTNPPGCQFSFGYLPASSISPETPIHKPETDLATRTPVMAEPKRILSQRLFDFYSLKSNYDLVYQNVFSWYGQKKDGCVAFLTTALRAIGLPLPVTKSYEGDMVSLETKSFVNYLQKELHWRRIDNLADAEPGDIGVTVFDAEFKEYPTHVFVLGKWISKGDLMVEVIDNQGFMIPRPLRANSQQQETYPDKDHTAYFIRSIN